VWEARDGVEALELAAAHPPHLAIIDLCMPNLSGFEVTYQLKQRHGAALPVLALSGAQETEERVRAFEAGADDFVPKPVRLAELLKRVGAFERTRRAYIELQRATERADRMRLLATEAAALLAHDLNNGLSIATANLQYVQEECRLDEEPSEALEVSVRALRRMAGLVRNFVDISRMEDGAIEPVRAEVDVTELLSATARIHDYRAGGPQIELSSPPGLTALVDPVLLERIIHNLLNNATRYVDAGGRIAVRARRVGGELVVAVGNSGAPIPPELRADLFAKYRKGRDGRAQCGMGLYFCRLACEAHGGTIALEASDEFATCFVLRLPLA
jgi:signal transduction histidine kinase